MFSCQSLTGGIVPHYRLEYCEGHGLRSDPEPYYFEAHSDDQAIEECKGILDIRKGEVTEESFHKAGGKALYCDNRQIFPNQGPPTELTDVYAELYRLRGWSTAEAWARAKSVAKTLGISPEAGLTFCLGVARTVASQL
jgi:hypothetical protein